jgi:hypothetical protein
VIIIRARSRAELLPRFAATSTTASTINLDQGASSLSAFRRGRAQSVDRPIHRVGLAAGGERGVVSCVIASSRKRFGLRENGGESIRISRLERNQKPHGPIPRFEALNPGNVAILSPKGFFSNVSKS